MTYLVFNAVIIKFPFSFFFSRSRPAASVFPSHVLVVKKRHENNQKVSDHRASVVASGRHHFSKTSAQLLKILG